MKGKNIAQLKAQIWVQMSMSVCMRVCVCVCVNTFKENTCVLPKAFGAEGAPRLYQPLQSPLNPSCVECVCFEVCARFVDSSGYTRVCVRACVFVCAQTEESGSGSEGKACSGYQA